MADLNKSLNDSASGPQSASNATESMRQHDLDKQVAATRFQMATRARSQGRAAGVSFTKLKPHGSVLTDGCGGNRSPVTGL